MIRIWCDRVAQLRIQVQKNRNNLHTESHRLICDEMQLYICVNSASLTVLTYLYVFVSMPRYVSCNVSMSIRAHTKGIVEGFSRLNSNTNNFRARIQLCLYMLYANLRFSQTSASCFTKNIQEIPGKISSIANFSVEYNYLF